MQTAIMEGQSLLDVDNLGYNFLHYACLEGNMEVCKRHASSMRLSLILILATVGVEGCEHAARARGRRRYRIEEPPEHQTTALGRASVRSRAPS